MDRLLARDAWLLERGLTMSDVEDDLAREISRLMLKRGGKVVTAYEAGPTGYGLHRVALTQHRPVVHR
jgi:hypothetical protein